MFFDFISVNLFYLLQQLVSGRLILRILMRPLISLSIAPIGFGTTSRAGNFYETNVIRSRLDRIARHPSRIVVLKWIIFVEL